MVWHELLFRLHVAAGRAYWSVCWGIAMSVDWACSRLSEITCLSSAPLNLYGSNVCMISVAYKCIAANLLRTVLLGVNLPSTLQLPLHAYYQAVDMYSNSRDMLLLLLFFTSFSEGMHDFAVLLHLLQVGYL